MTKILKIDIEKVKSVVWKGDSKLYDTELSKLGPKETNFIVFNPWLDNSQYFEINDIPDDNNKCLVFKNKDNWVAKYFPAKWTISNGYKEIEIVQNQETDFVRWSLGFKEAAHLYDKIKHDENDKKSIESLHKLCSKSVGEFTMHGALDAILYMKKNKNYNLEDISETSFLEKLFETIYKND
jgi:hypothetical protein